MEIGHNDRAELRDLVGLEVPDTLLFLILHQHGALGSLMAPTRWELLWLFFEVPHWVPVLLLLPTAQKCPFGATLVKRIVFRTELGLSLPAGKKKIFGIFASCSSRHFGRCGQQARLDPA